MRQVIGRLPLSVTDYSRARFDALVLDLLQYMNTFNGQFNDGMIQQMIDFANDEVEFNAQLLGNQINVQTAIPAPQQIASAVYSNVLDLEPAKGYTIGAY